VRRIAWLGAAAVAVVAAVPTERSGGAAASRVVDRTLVCTLLAPLGDARDLDVVASPPIVDEFRNFRVPAFIGVSSGRVLAGSVADRSNRVFVRAEPNRFQAPGRSLPPGVYASTRSCSATRASVPLSSKGLPGPPVEFGKDVECQLRGRVLVRVRAVLRTSAAWRRVQGGYAGARANVVEASLAVRTQPGRRPVAFIQLGRTGKTKLWTVGSCS
jgi:hypothetical protein